MPGSSDKRIIFAPILADLIEEDNAAPALSNLSPRDKPWDKHKKNADTIGHYYDFGGQNSYSSRVRLCASRLSFRLVPDGEQGLLKLKLHSALFCRVRLCTVCQWRRSLRWKAKAYEALPKVIEAYPKYRWLFVTLTMKNCALTELRETLSYMNRAFKRLTELKAFPGEGWIKSVEITRGKDGQSAHPHIHCLMMVKSTFFSSGYLSKKRWIELWQQCLRVDYKPILDVQAVKPHRSPVALLSEVLKYQTKESDLVSNPEWFLEYSEQVKKTRAVSVGGVLRDYFKALEEEPEDLIGSEESNEKEPDEGHLYFTWRRGEKCYRLTEAPLTTEDFCEEASTAKNVF